MSLLDELNRSNQQQRPRGVQFRLPPGLTPPAGLSPSLPQPSIMPRGDDLLSQLAAAAGPPVAPSSQDQGGGGFGRGLGFIVNNPITQAVVKPLEILDRPRRGVWSTIQETSDWLQGEGFSGGDWWKQFQDPTFGAGSVIPDTGNKWLDRGIGLAGDIVGDPLTWVTAGVGAIPGKAGRARVAGRLMRAQEAALEAGDQALIKSLGGMTDVQRIAKRGPGVANAAQLEAMALQRPGLKLGTRAHNVRIPGTETVARGVNEGFASARNVFNKTPGLESVRRGRHPVGLEDALEKIITGEGDIPLRSALNLIEGTNYLRVGEQKFGETMARKVNAAKEELKRPGLIAEAETPGTTNILNVIMADAKSTAERLGSTIPEMGGDRGGVYFPRRLAREFGDYLDGNAEARSAWSQASGMTTDDLLEESGHMQRRHWVPNEDGTPKVVKFGKPGSVGNGREIVIQTGTLDEVEGQLRSIFPEYRGQFYEHDPQIVLEGYVASMARNVGRDYMAQEMDKLSSSFARANFDSINGTNTRGEIVQEGMVDPYSRPVKNTELTNEANVAAAPSLRQAAEALDTKAGGLEEQSALAVSGARRSQLDNLDTIIADWGTPDRRGPRRRMLEAEGGVVQDGELVQRGSLHVQLSATGKKVSEAIAKHEQEVRILQKEIARLGQAAGGAKGRGKMAVLKRYKDVSKKLFALIDERKAITNKIRALSPEANANEIDSLVRELRQSADRAYEELLGGARGGGGFSLKDLQRQLDEIADVDDPLWSVLTPDQTTEWRAARKVLDASSNKAPIREVETKLLEVDQQIMLAKFKITKAVDQAEAAKKVRVRAPNTSKLQKELDTASKVLSEAKLTGRNRFKNFYEMVKDEVPQDVLDRMDEGLVDIMLGGERAAIAKKRINFLIAEWRKAQRIKIDKLEQAIAKAPVEAAVAAAKKDPIAAAQANLGRLQRIQKDLTAQSDKLKAPIEKARKVWEPLERLRQEAARAHAAEVGPIKARIDSIMKGIELEPGTGVILDGSLMDEIRGVRREADILAAENPDMTIKGLQRETPQQRSLRNQNPNYEATKALSNQGDVVEAGIGEASRDIERIMGGTDPVVNKIRVDTRRGIPATETTPAVPGVLELQNQQLNQRLRMLGVNEEHAAVMSNLDQQTNGVLAQLQTNAEAQTAFANEVQRARALKGKLGVHDPNKPNELRKSVDDFLEVMPFLNMTDDADRATATLLDNVVRNLETADSLRMEHGIISRELKKAESGQLHTVYTAVLRDGWTALHKGGVQKGDILIESELARRFANVYQITGDPKLLGRTLTAYTNFFKTYATMTPGFHVRNAMSNIFNNASDGVSLNQQLKGLRMWREYAKAADPEAWLLKQKPEIQAAFDAAIGSGAGGRFFESGVAAGPALGTASEKLFRNKFTKAGQELGQDWVEGPARLAMALDTIVGKSGGKLSMNELTMTALDRITRIHFDYGQVSRFDETARRLIPFWTFMSRNLPMQISQMWMKPRLYNQYNSFVRNFRGEDEEFTPDYFKNIGAFRFADSKLGGLPLYLQPDFAHTRVTEDIQNIEDVISGQNPARALSDFNPFFTAPAELITGQNFFTGRQYKDTDLQKVEGINNLMLPFLALMGQVEQSPDGSFIATEKGIDFMRSINPVLDRVTRLAPQTTGGDDALSRQLESIARTAGIPIRVLSPEQQRSTQRSQFFTRQDELNHKKALLEAQRG